jgi:hypothetical protein
MAADIPSSVTQEKNFPATMGNSAVGPSAAKNKQPSSLRDSGERPMEVSSLSIKNKKWSDQQRN